MHKHSPITSFAKAWGDGKRRTNTLFDDDFPHFFGAKEGKYAKYDPRLFFFAPHNFITSIPADSFQWEDVSHGNDGASQNENEKLLHKGKNKQLAGC